MAQELLFKSIFRVVKILIKRKNNRKGVILTLKSFKKSIMRCKDEDYR